MTTIGSMAMHIHRRPRSVVTGWLGFPELGVMVV